MQKTSDENTNKHIVQSEPFDKYLNAAIVPTMDASPIRSKTLNTLTGYQETKSNEVSNSQSDTLAERTVIAGGGAVIAKSRSLIKQNGGHVCNSPKCRKKKQNSSIQIVQDGDDIRINIDGNIEILTNRFNDRKVISLSPRLARKVFSPSSVTKTETSSKEVPHKEKEPDYKVETELIKELPISSLSEEKSINLMTNVLENEEISSPSTQENAEKKTLRASSNSLAVPLREDFSGIGKKTSSNENLVASNLRKGVSNETIASRNTKKQKGVKLKFLIDESSLVDTLHHQANEVKEYTSFLKPFINYQFA